MKVNSFKLGATWLLLAMGAAEAAEITVNGSYVSFTFEESLFGGNYQVLGNSLVFKPGAGFQAEALGTGPTIGALSQTVEIDVKVTQAGYALASPLVGATGTWSLEGNPASNNGLLTGIQAYADVTITDQNQVNHVANLEATTTATSTSLGGWAGEDTWQMQQTFDGVGGGSAYVSMVIGLRAAALGGGATEFAKIGAGSDGTVSVNAYVAPVPLPPAAWLFGAGIAVLGAVRSRLGSSLR